MKKTLSAALWLLLCAVCAWGTVPPGYYDKAQGQKKAALKAALHGIIGTAKTLDYGSGSGRTWYGFYQTDRLADNQVRDRYSREQHYFSGTSYSAPSGMNIEHSMAKSWWGGTNNQAYKDIHHLMPCESKINSSKSNYPMGVVSRVKTDNGCTKVGTGTAGSHGSTNLWEPADEWKGDFARVYFYMATCYSNLTWQSEGLKQMENNDWPTLQQWTYELLLRWNANDPVDAIETERNDAVYKIQGNRNPFIDHPELAEYIWGSKTAEAWYANGGGTVVPDEPVVLPSETFATSLGDFTAMDTDGGQTQVWTHSSAYKCAVGNAYNCGKVADAWLVSPVIDLRKCKTAAISFEHAAGYHTSHSPSEHFSVCVTYDVDEEAPCDMLWDELTVGNWPATVSSGFAPFVESGNVSLNEYCGSQVRIAFRYTSTTAACWAWEVRNFVATASTECLTGDVNGDGTIDTTDVTLLVGYIIGEYDTTFIAAAADVNGDGRIDVLDVAALIGLTKNKK